MGIASQFSLTNPVSMDGKAQIFSLAEMLKFPPPEWLIPGLVPKAGIVGLAGPPGVGKSMLALDWALCVGAGQPWLDRPIDRQFALYIAAEGHSGLQRRAEAWLRHRNLRPHNISFGLVKGRVQMTKDDETHEAVFQRVEDELRVTPGLVVIDTLARTVSGDENQNIVMDLFMTEAERWVENYGATVLVLHHKNASGTRERGHTSFRGTLHTLFFLDPVQNHKGLLKLHCEKQRDAREADDMGLRMQEVEGSDSVVLIEDVLPTRTTTPSIPSPMRKTDMLLLLSSHAEGLTPKEWMIAAGVPKRTFYRRLRQMVEAGQIYRDGAQYFSTPSVTDLAELGDDDAAEDDRA